MARQASQGLPGSAKARDAAARLVNSVTVDRALLSEAMSAPFMARLDPPDRARAQRLATETLRWMERCDKLLSRPLRKTPPAPVMTLLRLATWEIMSGGAAHGVVNDYVALAARLPRHGALKGLVNAVLRKIAAEPREAWDRLRIPRLPGWLRDPLTEAWGREAVAGMEAAHAAGAPLDLTVKSDARDWAARLGADLLPTGSLRLSDPGQVSGLPGYAEGAWWVQDAAAALPVELLAPLSGEKIADLCAAPGGKTLQLARAGADVTAVDASAQRMKRVTENLARTGLTARTLVLDALELTGRFDAILLDAPCSATGTIRRHPDLPIARDGAEIGGLIDLQTRLLDHAVTLLRPGGRICFCTCSLLPDEGEVQIDSLLARRDDIRMDRSVLDHPWIEDTWRSPEGGLRLRPDFWADRGGMDGFYMAVLRKAT